LSAVALLVLHFHRKGRFSTRLAIAAVLTTFILGLTTFGPLAWQLRAPERVTSWQFDVGQGDCGLLVFPDGWSLLIDTGGTFGFESTKGDGPLARSVLPFLSRNGISRLDAVVLTHGHRDHTGGASHLATSFPVESWYVSGMAQNAIRGLVDSLRVHHPHTGDLLHRWGDWEVIVEYPPPDLPDDLDENDHSLVVSLRRAGKVLAVWSGDLEHEGENILLARGGSPRNTTVLKAGHHGSDTSGGPELMTRLNPELVLLSCGVGNRYGHPSHGPYLARGDTVDITRTDLEGSIRLEWNRTGGLTWRTMVSGPRQISQP
jgi:competence protein ComEC